MNNIQVEPYIPDEDYDNPAMVTDFYEFSMANSLFMHGYKDTIMVFNMFFRDNPDDGGYAISCGQQKLLRFLKNYHFTDFDIQWLLTKGMSPEFCEYLRHYQWKGDVYMLREGTVCYPQVPMVRIECDMVGAVLIETYLLQTMNFHSLIATKATRITGLSNKTPRNVMEFGTRRAQGMSAGNDGAYAETYPENVSLLLDTYSIFDSGLPHLIQLDDELIAKYPNDPNKRVKSARIDSGDLARGYKRLRRALDEAGKSYIKLVASNSLDEKKMANMELYEHAKFDFYGVGEKLITAATDPVFGGVYKLVAVKEKDGSYTPKMKCSDSSSKAIIPGKLMAWRVFDEEGKGQCDIISLDTEVIENGKPVEVVNLDSDAFERHKTIIPSHVEKILIPHMLNGEIVLDLPDIRAKKEYVKEQLQYRVWESELRTEMPHKHYVDLTPAVAKLREELYEKLHGGII